MHVVAAASWVGSMVFFSAVLVPVFRREGIRQTMPDFIVRLGQRSRRRRGELWAFTRRGSMTARVVLA
jgi:putative copper export protein